MRRKQIVVALLALVLSTSIIGGASGCHSVGSDMQKKQELADTISYLSLQSSLCSQFHLDFTVICSDDIKQAQIIMYPGEYTFWRFYSYSLSLQEKLSEAEKDPQNQYLQEVAAEIRNIDQEGLITMESLRRHPEKMNAIWRRVYLDVNPPGPRYTEIEGIKPADWPGLSGLLTKEYLTPYTQKGIESEGTAIEIILAKLNKLDAGIPGSNTPILYESCRKDKWKETLSKPADQINEDESLMLALVYMDILDQKTDKEMFVNQLADKIETGPYVRWKMNRDKIAKIQKALDLYVFLLYEEYDALAAMKTEKLENLYRDISDNVLSSKREDHLYHLHVIRRHIEQKQALLIAVNDLERYNDNKEDPWPGLLSQNENDPPFRINTGELYRQGPVPFKLSYCDHNDETGHAGFDKTLTIDIVEAGHMAPDRVAQLIDPYLE